MTIDEARIVVELTRELSALRGDRDGSLELAVVAELDRRWLQEVAQASSDFNAWLIREVMKARNWSTLDVIAAWHLELARRANARAKVAA